MGGLKAQFITSWRVTPWVGNGGGLLASRRDKTRGEAATNGRAESPIHHQLEGNTLGWERRGFIGVPTG